MIDKIENKIKNCKDLRKNRMVIEFNVSQSSSVKSITVKNETNIKCTTRFMSGKLLMFAKLSLKSFIYSVVELLYFPEENLIVASIYETTKLKKFTVITPLQIQIVLQFNLLLFQMQIAHFLKIKPVTFYLNFFLKLI